MARPDMVWVLSGGGNRGAYQAAAAQELLAAGYVPEAIIGTSAGALNGAMIAMGMDAHEVRDYWIGLRRKEVVRMRRDLWRWAKWDSVQDAAPLESLLDVHLDHDRMRASSIDLRITAVDLEAGLEVVFEKDELTVAHFLASAALVPVMPPVRIGGRTYVDGGHWSPFAVRHAAEMHPKHILGILHAPAAPFSAPVPRGVSALVRRVTEVRVAGREMADLENIRLRMHLPRRDPAHLPYAPIDLVYPRPAFTEDILDFSEELSIRMWDRGVEDGRAMVQRLDAA